MGLKDRLASQDSRVQKEIEGFKACRGRVES